MPGDGDAIKPARALRAFPRSAKVRPLRAGGDLAHDRFSKGCSMTYRKVRGSSARFAARFAGGVMASVLVASAAMAAPAPKVPPVDQALMREVVKTLASDALEGRGPSTAAEPKVLDAIIARFKQAGLQPGNKGGWLQDVPTPWKSPQATSARWWCRRRAAADVHARQGFRRRQLPHHPEDRRARQRTGLRGLWRQRAGAGLERLCRR
jgi:hypothetical protein